jgi:hypothetical protein
MKNFNASALDNLVGRLKRYHADFPGSPCEEAAEAIADLRNVIKSTQQEKLLKRQQTPPVKRKRIKVRLPRNVPILERLNAYLDKQTPTGCWNWMGSGNNKYGYIRYKTKSWPVHRLMYSLSNKGKLRDGEVVMHICDNTWCCNPEHLTVGTHADNMIDKTLKGRHHWGKISLENAKELRIRFANGESCYALAAEFGINHSTVFAIGQGRSWRVLNDDPDIKALTVKKGHERWSNLTDDDVREIKNLLANGVNQGEIAKKFQINPSTVSAINTGRRWTHVV